MWCRFSRLLSLSHSERLLLAEAAMVLLAGRAALALAGLRTCLALTRAARARPIGRPGSQELDALALAVRRASAGLPVKLDCLPQSLAVAWLLARRGIQGELKIGVRMNAGALQAHAWVEASQLGWRFDADPAGGYVPFEAPLH